MRYIEEQNPLECNNGAEEQNDKQTKIEDF